MLTWYSIQMEMDNYRNESRADIKRADIRMEDVVHSAMIKISDIRTEIEQAKWDNTRRGVGKCSPFDNRSRLLIIYSHIRIFCSGSDRNDGVEAFKKTSLSTESCC
jgi:hypothetical protein